MTPAARLRTRTLLLSIVALCLLTEYASDVVWKLRYQGWGDFRAFYTAAAAVGEGRSMYDMPDMTEVWLRRGSPEYKPYIHHVFTYPPLFGASLQPLTWLDFRLASRAWGVANAILWLCCIWGTLRLLDLTPDDLSFWVLGFVGLRFEPALSTLTYGQVNIVVYALVLASLTGLKHRRPVWAGAFLAMAVMAKITPVIIAGYFLVRRQWQALIWTCVGGLLLLGAGILWVGVQAHLDYVLEVLPGLSAGFTSPENQSLFAWFRRLFIAFGATDHLGPAIWLARAAGLLLGFCVLRLLLAAPGDPSRLHLGEISLCMVLMSVASPVTWTHHLTWILLPLGVLFGAERCEAAGEHSLAQSAVLGAVVAVLAVVDDYYVHPFFRNGLWVLVSSIKLYALLALYLLLCRRLAATSPPPAARQAVV